MCGVNAMLKKLWGKKISRLLSFAFVLFSLLLVNGLVWGANDTNKLMSVSLDTSAASPTVQIGTEEPVGYRYTVYDSFDPIRVVIDFPGMDVSDVAESLPVDKGPVQEVRVSSFELSSGKLARVEILLTENTEYQVNLDGSNFRIAFAADEVAATTDQNQAVDSAQDTSVAIVDEPVDPNSLANVLKSVEVSSGQAVLQANGKIDKFRHFVLGNPPRLVVDVYGLRPAFKARSFAAEDGFSKIRIGTYSDKTRLVFDADGGALPDHLVTGNSTDINVRWGDVTSLKTAESKPAEENSMTEKPAEVVKPMTEEKHVEAADEKPAPKTTEVASSTTVEPVKIEAIDFNNDDGKSTITVSLSGQAKVTGPVAEGNLVRFEIVDASISRALRRTIDASAFPSAVTSVTPYTVTEGDKQNVRIAVDLKSPVAYALEQSESAVSLVIDDTDFVEAAPPAVSQVGVVAPEREVTPARTAERQAYTPTTDTVTADEMAAEAARYTGEKITLVFDSANVRSILQLIGDVSGLNILASSDVQGTVTLRLIDVPWDQALELVLETADLGKIQQGNILRIMPKSKIRELEQEAMKEQMVAIEEGVLETKTFLISYASVGDMKTYLTDIKSDRGSIIADSRNKQLIVRDAAAVLTQMEEMIAQIDKPERQVMIEARIVEANTNFTRSLGVKWNTDWDNQGDPSSDTFSLNNMSTGLGGSFFIPVTNPASAGVTAAMTIGSLKNNFELDLRLSALENSGEGRIVSTPRITTLNGEQAVISQGTKIPFSSVSDTGTDVTFENAELKLSVTPEINPDGSILLEIDASNSSVGTVVPTATGDAVSIDEKKAQTKVLVRDGQTTVIGGIFIEQEQDAETGVPLLKDVPFLGHLFKSTTKSRERRELLIFITPRIVES